jgi:hypothetical protein
MPQLYAIRASQAQVALVIAHQGPWFHLARWDLKSNALERGAWLRGRIYQRRCDLSPDGRLFYYFGMKGGRVFHAVSRAPWLTALARWRDDSTYNRGYHFESTATRGANLAAPDEGNIAPLAERYRLQLVPNSLDAYGAERRRGWTSHREAPRRPTNDIWNEKTPHWLVRERPGGDQCLELRDNGYVRGRLEGRAPRYALDGERLTEAVWADWDARGRLLVATRAGVLEIRSSKNKVTHSVSLAGDWTPDPAAPPMYARRW